MIRAIAASVAVLCLGGCVSDSRKEIAFQTLFFTNDHTNTAAIAGALSARFPAGSSIEPFKAYVAAIGGSCAEREAGRLRCEVAMRTRLCAAEMLGFNVATRAGSIERIDIQIGDLGC